MKKQMRTLMLAAGLLTVTLPVFAAGDAVLTSFLGGRVDLNISAASQLLSGPGVSAVTTSSTAATRPDPFAVFGNPSSWSIVREGTVVGIAIQPHLSVNSLPAGMQSSFQENVDQAISGFSSSQNVEYPDLAGVVARKANVFSGLGLIVPVKDWRFGVGYTRPIAINVGVENSGLSQSIRQDYNVPTESVALDLQSQVAMQMSLNSDRYVLGASREFGRWSFGMSVARTDLEMSVSGGYEIDGEVSYGDRTLAFNDPNDPWHNRFRGEADGGYKGSIYTGKFGATWQLGSNPETAWTMAANATINVGGSMTGSMDLVVDEYLPLQPLHNEDGNTFDLARLGEGNELTRTYENHYYAGETLTVETPNSFSFGIAKPNGLRPNLTLTAYTGNLAYSVDVREKRVDDTDYTTNTYSRGIKPIGSAYLGFSPNVFFLGVGVTYAQDIVEGYNGTNGENLQGGSELYIPRADLGMILPLSKNLRAEVLFVGLPEDAMRIGFVWEF